MKKLVLGIMLVACTALVFGQSVVKQNFKLSSNDRPMKLSTEMPNGMKGTGTDNNGFETWNNTLGFAGLGEMPNGWLMITGNPAAQKSNTAQAGQYAIHVESGVITNPVLQITDSLIGGTAFIGAFTGSALAQGEPFTQNLTSIDGYVRGNLLGQDTAVFVCQIWNGAQQAEVALGLMLWGGDELSANWTPFTLTLEYEVGAPAPDSIVMFMSSTGYGLFQGFNIGTLTAGSWVEFDSFTYNVETPTTPVAAVNPMAWAAGAVMVGENATSPTFTLTNNGSGTLTVSNATALSAPWSTTFSAGAVSLGAGETYTFTFGFAPTVAGAANQAFVLTTNGGNLTINLSGTGAEGCGDVTTYPYFEGFEGLTEFYCWETQYNTGADGGINGNNLIDPPTNNTWFVCQPSSFGGNGADYINTGTRSAAIGYTAPEFNWLISPNFVLPATPKELRFYMWYFQDATYNTNFYVNIYSNGTWTPALTYTSGTPTNEFEEVVTVDLTAYANQTIKIAFVYEYTDGYQLAIDDITVGNPVGIGSEIANTINVYPNPANNVITITNAENTSITVINILGKVVAKVDNASANQNIDISNLSQGTYFVNVDGNIFKLNVVK